MNECTWKDRLQDLGLLALRILIGYGIARHGWGKLTGDMAGFATGVVAGKLGFPIPMLFAWAAALSEFLGGIALITGLLTRVGACFVLCVMGTAFFLFHTADPWDVKELAFVYGSVALGLILTGGGRYSLDSLWCRKKCCPVGGTTTS